MDANNMCDTQLLVSYLYDEIEPASRRALEAHLASCAECRGEVAALRATRRQLAEWTPPEQQAGFQIVSRGAAPARPAFLRFSPMWGLAAAAVLVLAAAAAIANVEVRYGADGMTVRTGWGRTPVQAAQAVQPSALPASVTADLETVQRRLDQLEAARSQPAALQTAPGPRVSDAEVLRRVSALLAESETRQNRELALRIRQLAAEMEAQRRVDLATIQQGLQGATAAEAATHQQLWNYAQGLYRVSQQSLSK
jgi:hypothetical protein